MTCRRGNRGKLIESYLDHDVSPIIAAIARNHVPEKSRHDFVEFVSTGCSMTQLNMIIRYMGGTPPPLVHIEIEESGGQIHATAQFGGGLNFTGDAVMINQRLPETIRTALVGRPLSALIDHPLLPGDEKIIAIREMGIGNFFNRRYRTQNRMTRYQWKN